MQQVMVASFVGKIFVLRASTTETTKCLPTLDRSKINTEGIFTALSGLPLAVDTALVHVSMNISEYVHVHDTSGYFV